MASAPCVHCIILYGPQLKPRVSASLAQWSALALERELHDNLCETGKSSSLPLLDWGRICLKSRASSYWAPGFR